ncbi:MAG: M28 family peptidase [Holophaga sp.]|nr:M28 family peptidase [Holophaga sp.]
MKHPGIVAFTLPFLLAAQEPAIDKDALRGHLAFLSDDLLEGRGMGQRGGDLAVRYLETQLRVLGLRPANGDSYLQSVKLVSMHPKLDESRIVFETPKGPLDLQLGKDFFLAPSGPETLTQLNAPLVFVGHGISGKPGRWDSDKGLDLRGKVLVMLMGERMDTNAHEPCCTPTHYQGRWVHKIEEGLRQGAAAVLIVHTPISARYEWSVACTGWSGERFALDTGSGTSILGGFISQDAARKLFMAVGRDLDALTRRSEDPAFRPIELGIQAKGTVLSKVRHLIQYNVAGLLPGTDPALKDESVVYSAHWDHFGRHKDGRIFNGAVDNASGLAAVLAIAHAAIRKPTRRSQLFLFLTGEEAGLLGATAYVRSPLRPMSKTAAVLNLESLNFLGETRDIAALGADFSELGDHAKTVAASMGLRFRGCAPDPAGLYFRADHFAFVRGGVPAISPGFSLNGGWDYVQDPKASQLKAEDWLRNGYHQPADRYDPTWKLDGMAQQTQFVFALGQVVANAPEKPRWLNGVPNF